MDIALFPNGVRVVRTLYVISIAVLLLNSGCGLLGKKRLLNTGSRSGEAPASKVKVIYDSSVPGWQQDLIEGDLSILTDASFSDNSESEVLGITSFSNESLRDWLQVRYSYLVGETFTKNRTLEKAMAYSPYISEISPLGATTIMQNWGGAIYLTGKEKSEVYSIDVAGNRIVIDSSRVGVFKVGEGMFSVNMVSGTSVEDEINSYLRLATGYHEARHDDGNGTNAAFPHEVCTSGTYSGSPACDKNTNGPYPVGRVILQKFRDTCDGCSSSERRALDLHIADLNSRLVPGAIARDERPERISP